MLPQFFLGVSVFVYVPMTFYLNGPQLQVGEEFGTDGWLSINMWAIFILFELLYMFGFTFRVFEPHMRYLWKTALKPYAIGVRGV